MKKRVYLILSCLVLFQTATIVLGIPGSVHASDTEPSDPGPISDFCEFNGSSSGGSGGASATPVGGGATSDINESAYCKELTNRFNSATPPDPIGDDESPLLGKNSILYRVIQMVIAATAAVSVIMIIIGGFRYVTSGGDSTGTKGAKDTILYAVIGLVVAIFAQTIVVFVLSKL